MDDSIMQKYELDEDFSTQTAVEFGRVYKKMAMKFEAIGMGQQRL
jgi:stress response protein SCP2